MATTAEDSTVRLDDAEDEARMSSACCCCWCCCCGDVMTTSSSSMVNNSVSDTSLAPCSGARGIAGAGATAAAGSGEYSSPAECSGGLRGETRGGEMSPMSLTSLMPGEKLERKRSFSEKLR